MAPRSKANSFFSQLQVNYGPAGLLGRFFICAEAFAKQRGVSLSLGSMQDLLEVNSQNSATWLPLGSMLNPQFNDLNESNSFCILGRDLSGAVVATQAARVFYWDDTNYYEEAKSLRLLYDDPDESKLPDETMEIDALAAKGITGTIVYTGGAWFRRDFRGIGLLDVLPRLSRAYAHALWNPSCAVTMMVEENVRKGVYPRNGQKNIEWGVHMRNSRSGTLHLALLWTKREEGLSDLSQFLSSLDVNTKITRRAGGAE